MKKINILFFVFTVFFVSCKKESGKPVNSVTLDNPINDFTWKAMNSWYKWQADVPSLADAKKNNEGEYHTYLNSFNNPEDLFKSLRYKTGEVDRFSWFIKNYEDQENAFQGVYNGHFGFNLSKIDIKDSGNSILLVKKVSKNSPANQQGIKRGDIIIGIDGQKFENGNYSNAIKGISKNTVEFILGEKDGITEKSRVIVTRGKVVDDAIHFSKIFENVAGKKVGYLAYNGFRSSYDKALNNEFAKFKTEGVNEFILDLRYNRGGNILTCLYLSSMIYGEGKSKQDIFAKYIHNSKKTNRNRTLPFLDGMLQYNEKGEYIEGQDIPLNRLSGISKLYVLTSERTASASEMVINGLRPYIEVVTIGKKTSGKNVGSNTLYDSPSSDYLDKKSANTNHKYALQPITLKIYNKLNQSDYTNGFIPDFDVEEIENWNNLLPFGDENEILLKTALNLIKGISARTIINDMNITISNSNIDEKPFEEEMYFESEYMINFIK